MLKAPYVTNYLSEHFVHDDYGSLAGYERRGGYEAARKALGMAPDDIIELVRSSGLQGRGGAGFLTGLKWSFMPKETDKPKYLICNADESEPGSFKDRILLERAPHLMLDGILVGARAIGAEKTFIYIRGEYAYAAQCLQRAIDEAYSAGHLGDDCLGTGFVHDIVLQRGAGAYICGEETGLLESLEGKKGMPRNADTRSFALRGRFNRPGRGWRSAALRARMGRGCRGGESPPLHRDQEPTTDVSNTRSETTRPADSIRRV